MMGPFASNTALLHSNAKALCSVCAEDGYVIFEGQDLRFVDRKDGR